VGDQELIAQPSVERLDQPVVGGLSGPGVVELSRRDRPGMLRAIAA
jgi:hypothetical protein